MKHRGRAVLAMLAGAETASLNSVVSWPLKGQRMDITRRGSERDHGIRTIVSGHSLKASTEERWYENVSWDPTKKQVEIYLRWVRHTDGTTHHDYTIRLTLDDVSALIALLGHAGSASDAKLLRNHLSKHIPAIVKLLACAAGVAPIPMESEDAASNVAS